jgi:hypothetical protein
MRLLEGRTQQVEYLKQVRLARIAREEIMICAKSDELVEVHLLELYIRIFPECVMKGKLEQPHDLQIFLVSKHVLLLEDLLLALILVLEEVHAYQNRANGDKRFLLCGHLWEHLLPKNIEQPFEFLEVQLILLVA